MIMRKIVRRILKEALGVPEGIVQNSKILYDEIMNQLESVDKDDQEDEYEFLIRRSFTIGDYTINKIKFNLEIHEHNKILEPTIASFGFGVSHDIQVKNKMKMVHNITDSVSLASNIVVPNDWNFGGIVELFKKNKDKIIRSLAHELKHSYDYYKKRERDPYSSSMYQTYANMGLGLPPIDRFIHNLYFSHLIENLVRPSEVATTMELKGVTQKQFLEFLKDDETYTQLKEISNFSVDKLKEDLKNYIPQIDQILSSLNEEIDIPIDQKIDRMLEIIYITLVNAKGSTIRQIISTEIPEKLFSVLRPDKEPFFEKMINKIQRFPSYKEFYEYEEKMFKYTSRKMIQKLGKLYAAAKIDQSDVYDWELHQKINKKKYDRFVKETKYYRPKK